MPQPRQPLIDEFEMDANGLIRDTDTGEVFGHVPTALQSLYNASPDLLAACEGVMEFLSNGAPVQPGCLLQAEVFNAIQKAKQR